ncbi:dihydrodipicolinate synthase family protein [Poseidonocella sp. HB161398]|uniref:dihydrodipicolinate synthase family protein n=1 Tax=Poseidonocella sp. HB161398 TaxID=2320855 RepID=UPI0011088598|nr:dihydrodipicolinate synthase family protein [Poseidonocella sp. HB161398]
MPDTSRLVSALSGVSGILVAPFDGNDRLDPARLGPIIEMNLQAGTHILVSNGNTGEFYGLGLAEAEAHVAATAGMVAGRTPVLAGIGRSVGEACALARASALAGADGLMVHQPPDPFASPRGVADYIRRVRDAGGGLPLVLYLRNAAMGPERIADLCRIEGVAGVKWAVPDPMALAAAMAASPDHVQWVGGLAETWAPAFYAVGARGFTSGLVNLWPERSLAIHACLEAGDYAGARAAIAGMAVFEEIRAQELNGANVTGVKAALAMTGRDCGPARPPSAWPLAGTETARLRQFLEGAGLLARGAA